MQRHDRSSADRRWYWLLLIPVVAMLWVPSYNRLEPSLAGVPFFYWYQFVWIMGTSLVTLCVYLLAHAGERE
jgi:Protein of unknown function (DUF3311)